MVDKNEVEIAIARAGFAAAAVAKLARALKEAGAIDNLLLGELAGVAVECASGSDNADVIKAMKVLRAQLGLPD